MQQPDIVLEKKIGSGSFGDVYSGHLKSTGEKIAVKRVKKKILKQYGEYLINAFWKEINSMKLCDCQNSVHLIQTLETENNYNIVMELCDTDLLCYLNKSPVPFTVEEVRDTFKQLNNVFRIMNKNKIIHRDLKLGNILIKFTDKNKKKFVPKLSDYGFSKDLNNSNYTATHLGTPATMAPEIMMNKPYNEKSDIWSIGAMMYQLHYKEIPYPGFSEQQILAKIQRNHRRNQPTDPDFRDLLNKIFVVDPDKRMSWEEYFNHPFFKDKTPPCLYEKISDFNLGYDYNIKEKDLFYCFIAKSNATGKNVLIKSYRMDFMEKNKQLFTEEISLFNAFKAIKIVLPLIETNKENNRFNMVFEYLEGEALNVYLKNHEMKEKNIKKFNQTLYNDLLVFNECNFLPFIFISIHNFLIDKNLNPIVYDFGIHKLLLSQEEYASYFLPNISEMNYTTQNRIKTNVLNYGVTLLKLFTGNNIRIKNKEIILPEDKIMSEDFSIFLGKCLTRNYNKRASWLGLGSCGFVLDSNVESSNIVGDALINEDKLKEIFVYLNTKFESIINFYNKENFANNEFLSQIEIFTSATLFEMKIIEMFFNKCIDYEPNFTNQQEISFISINSDYEMNKCDINFVNPVLKDLNLIKTGNNELIKNFCTNFESKINKMEQICKSIQPFIQNSSCSGDYSSFIHQIINSIDSFNSSSMQHYFSNMIKRSSEEKSKEKKYNALCIAKYLIEFIIFIITIINDSGKRINLQRNILLKKFYKIFGEEKNKIEISTFNLKNDKKRYLIVSFLPILFKCREDDFALSKDKQSINRLVRYYPSLMSKLDEVKNN